MKWEEELDEDEGEQEPDEEHNIIRLSNFTPID